MPVFVDTGGWFAYFVRRDPDHTAAVNCMRQNRQPLITTDYILDELFTLLNCAKATVLRRPLARRYWTSR